MKIVKKHSVKKGAERVVTKKVSRNTAFLARVRKNKSIHEIKIVDNIGKMFAVDVNESDTAVRSLKGYSLPELRNKYRSY